MKYKINHKIRDSKIYKTKLKRYFEIIRLTPKQLIKESLEDTNKPMLERQDILKIDC